MIKNIKMKLFQKAKQYLYGNFIYIRQAYRFYQYVSDKIRQLYGIIIIRFKYNKHRLSTDENFLKLHIGFGDIKFKGYINIDFRKTAAADFVCNIAKLPFPDNSVEIIETYHVIEHLPHQYFIETIKNWWNKLIPGGKLVIECPDFDKAVLEYLSGSDMRLYNIFGRHRFQGDAHSWGYNFSRLSTLLDNSGFKGIRQCIPQDYHRLEEPCIRVEAYKSINTDPFGNSDAQWLERKNRRPETLTLEWRKNYIHSKILNELKQVLFKEKTISLGCGSGELEVLSASSSTGLVTGVDISREALAIAVKHKVSENLNNINFLKASIFDLPFHDNGFDGGYAVEVIEYIEPELIPRFFSEIKRILEPNARLLITVPNKNAYYDPDHRTFFTKGTLTQLIDSVNLSFDWIDYEERSDKYRRYDMLKAMVVNKPGFQVLKKTKICAVGAYELYGYSQLGFHWDGQSRGFKELGYETLLLDIRKDVNYENLRKKIIDFQPDIIWCGLKDCLDFLQWMKKDIIDLRKKGTKVIYWFCDLRTPGKSDLKELIDIMFLSNSGQIDIYRKSYNIENVFYMPQACTPAFMHRMDMEETCDIGHAGTLDRIHANRKKLLKKISKKYKVVIKDQVRNNISNFYSQSGIVFGSNPDQSAYLCTSNRLFVAMGCGAFYLCEWFPGIEKLAQNHEHLVWFKTEKELFDLISYYLEHKQEREKIRENAQILAHSKHTYINRIKNMIDIIEGKTEKFYGFLETRE
ncbi:SAM-dependent methyltransferase, type 11 [Desulfonema limicola]|uniref:SAM-dependent methyltransferase, type 11 n=1 Tax=Desulfonema limicola TaxID=45656 RepID=A0A975B644_9BACT|nr:methyltransferase domain-containing protein [Desulfonema limicola]QTA79479.1 SAM-dependent methyltransferase, type 11 [Desulfonema limicola]